MSRRMVVGTMFVLLLAGPLRAQDAPPASRVVEVADKAALGKALRAATPGTTIRVAAGTYAGGFFLGNVHGAREAPIVIAGADPENPPVFTGSGEGAKLSCVAYLKLSNLSFESFGPNGINVDDGGDEHTPSHHVIFENLTILETGIHGNHDALKLSGVRHFVVRRCRFEAWGGSGVDIVGCHHGVIEDSRFIGRPDARQKNAVQMKGGSSDILVQCCYFENAGERGVAIGGSTGPDFFRPSGVRYEAKDITVAGNIFVGGEAAVAWVTSQRGYVHHNIIYLPTAWPLRILQEGRGMQPCADGIFQENLVIYDDRVQTVLNIGEGTIPTTFSFIHNAWFRLDADEIPELPTVETDGVYQVWPELADEKTEKMHLLHDDPAYDGIGPRAYEPWRIKRDFDDVTLPTIPNVPEPRPPAKIKQYVIFAVIGVAVIIALLIKLIRHHLRRKRRRRRRERIPTESKRGRRYV